MKIDRHIRFHFARKCNLGAALVLVLLVATVAHAQLTPSDDAYVNSAAPTTNYGAATTLDLSSAADTTFIRFDLTAVPAGTPGSSIAKATLKLYVNSVTTAGSFNVDYVTGTWVEKTITNNLQPAIGTTIASSVPLTTASKGKYVEIDVTAAMVEWLNGTQANDGIALVANSPLVATFDSKENTGTSHPAELDVVFASGNGTITGINTASGSGLMGGGNSGTLNLSLINTCSSGQVLSWNGTAWTCANLSGGGTITGVTAGTDLTGGGTSGKVTLNLDTTKVPQLNTPNNFTQAIGVNTNNPFGSIQATGTGEAIVGIMTTNNFLTAAIAGAATASGTGTTIGVEGSSSTNSGYGVYGTGGPSGAGVYGNGNSSGVGVSGNSSSGVGVSGTSSSGSGVYGQTTGASGAGVFGTNSVSGFGVLGQATGSSGQGVWGETFGNGFSNGAGADGVHGVAQHYGWFRSRRHQHRSGRCSSLRQRPKWVRLLHRQSRPPRSQRGRMGQSHGVCRSL